MNTETTETTTEAEQCGRLNCTNEATTTIQFSAGMEKLACDDCAEDVAKMMSEVEA